MRGSPLIRALVALAFLIALAPLIARVTRQSTVAAPASAPAAETAEVEFALQFTTAPERVRLLHLGKEIFKADAPGTTVEGKLALAWPDEGVDLTADIAWPASAPLAAMRLRVTTPAGDEREATIWGTGPTTESVTIK